LGQKPWGAPDTRATDAKPLENQTLWIGRSKGISSPTEVHFVITKGWINFYEFARVFRDGLGSSNALFLDGGEAPWLYAPELGPQRRARPWRLWANYRRRSGPGFRCTKVTSLRNSRASKSWPEPLFGFVV